MEFGTLIETGVNFLLPSLVIIGLVAVVFWAIKNYGDHHGRGQH